MWVPALFLQPLDGWMSPALGEVSSFGGVGEDQQVPFHSWHPSARRGPGPGWESSVPGAVPTAVGTRSSHPNTVPSLCRGDAISYARIHQQQKQMDEEKLTGALEGQAL